MPDVYEVKIDGTSFEFDWNGSPPTDADFPEIERYIVASPAYARKVKAKVKARTARDLQANKASLGIGDVPDAEIRAKGVGNVVTDKRLAQAQELQRRVGARDTAEQQLFEDASLTAQSGAPPRGGYPVTSKRTGLKQQYQSTRANVQAMGVSPDVQNDSWLNRAGGLTARLGLGGITSTDPAMEARLRKLSLSQALASSPVGSWQEQIMPGYDEHAAAIPGVQGALVNFAGGMASPENLALTIGTMGLSAVEKAAFMKAMQSAKPILEVKQTADAYRRAGDIKTADVFENAIGRILRGDTAGKNVPKTLTDAAKAYNRAEKVYKGVSAVRGAAGGYFMGEMGKGLVETLADAEAWQQDPEKAFASLLLLGGAAGLPAMFRKAGQKWDKRPAGFGGREEPSGTGGTGTTPPTGGQSIAPRQPRRAKGKYSPPPFDFYTGRTPKPESNESVFRQAAGDVVAKQNEDSAPMRAANDEAFARVLAGEEVQAEVTRQRQRALPDSPEARTRVALDEATRVAYDPTQKQKDHQELTRFYRQRIAAEREVQSEVERQRQRALEEGNGTPARVIPRFEQSDIDRYRVEQEINSQSQAPPRDTILAPPKAALEEVQRAKDAKAPITPKAFKQGLKEYIQQVRRDTASEEVDAARSHAFAAMEAYRDQSVAEVDQAISEYVQARRAAEGEVGDVLKDAEVRRMLSYRASINKISKGEQQTLLREGVTRPALPAGQDRRLLKPVPPPVLRGNPRTQVETTRPTRTQRLLPEFKRTPIGEQEAQARVLKALSTGQKHNDQLLSETGLDTNELATASLMLELYGKIDRKPGNIFVSKTAYVPPQESERKVTPTPVTPTVAAVVEPTPVPIAAPAPVTTTPAPQSINGLEYIDPATVQVHPDIQYKKEGVIDQKNRVSNALKGVDTYDRNQGGVWTVYRDENGQLFSVNSHHRRELANRASRFGEVLPDGTFTETPREVPARVLDAKDGWTPANARVQGALENLRDGKGTALDALDVIRENGMSPERLQELGVSINTTTGRNLRGLMNLDEQSIVRVKLGDLPQEVAAGVGSVRGLEPATRTAALNAAAKAGYKAFSDGESIANEYLTDQRDGTLAEANKGAQSSMFGDEFAADVESTQALRVDIKNALRDRLLKERAQIMDGVKLEARDGEVVDKAGRQADAQNLGESANALKERIAVVFNNPNVNDAIKKAAVEAAGSRGAKERVVDALYAQIRPNVGRSINHLNTFQLGEIIPADAAPTVPTASGLFGETPPTPVPVTPKPVEVPPVVAPPPTVAERDKAIREARKPVPVTPAPTTPTPAVNPAASLYGTLAAGKRNSQLAEAAFKKLSQIESVSDDSLDRVADAIESYKEIQRNDFADVEDYNSARLEAWDEFLGVFAEVVVALDDASAPPPAPTKVPANFPTQQTLLSDAKAAMLDKQDSRHDVTALRDVYDQLKRVSRKDFATQGEYESELARVQKMFNKALDNAPKALNAGITPKDVWASIRSLLAKQSGLSNDEIDMTRRQMGWNIRNYFYENLSNLGQIAPESREAVVQFGASNQIADTTWGLLHPTIIEPLLQNPKNQLYDRFYTYLLADRIRGERESLIRDEMANIKGTYAQAEASLNLPANHTEEAKQFRDLHVSHDPVTGDPIDDAGLQAYFTQASVAEAVTRHTELVDTLFKQNLRWAGMEASGQTGHFTKAFVPAIVADESGNVYGSNDGSEYMRPTAAYNAVPGARAFKGTAEHYAGDYLEVMAGRLRAGTRAANQRRMIDQLLQDKVIVPAIPDPKADPLMYQYWKAHIEPLLGERTVTGRDGKPHTVTTLEVDGVPMQAQKVNLANKLSGYSTLRNTLTAADEALETAEYKTMTDRLVKEGVITSEGGQAKGFPPKPAFNDANLPTEVWIPTNILREIDPFFGELAPDEAGSTFQRIADHSLFYFMVGLPDALVHSMSMPSRMARNIPVFKSEMAALFPLVQSAAHWKNITKWAHTDQERNTAMQWAAQAGVVPHAFGVQPLTKATSLHTAMERFSEWTSVPLYGEKGAFANAVATIWKYHGGNTAGQGINSPDPIERKKADAALRSSMRILNTSIGAMQARVTSPKLMKFISSFYQTGQRNRAANFTKSNGAGGKVYRAIAAMVGSAMLGSLIVKGQEGKFPWEIPGWKSGDVRVGTDTDGKPLRMNILGFGDRTQNYVDKMLIQPLINAIATGDPAGRYAADQGLAIANTYSMPFLSGVIPNVASAVSGKTPFMTLNRDLTGLEFAPTSAGKVPITDRRRIMDITESLMPMTGALGRVTGASDSRVKSLPARAWNVGSSILGLPEIKKGANPALIRRAHRLQERANKRASLRARTR